MKKILVKFRCNVDTVEDVNAYITLEDVKTKKLFHSSISLADMEKYGLSGFEDFFCFVVKENEITKVEFKTIPRARISKKKHLETLEEITKAYASLKNDY